MFHCPITLRIKNTESKIAGLRMSRQNSRALKQTQNSESGALWLHRSYTHEADWPQGLGKLFLRRSDRHTHQFYNRVHSQLEHQRPARKYLLPRTPWTAPVGQRVSHLVCTRVTWRVIKRQVAGLNPRAPHLVGLRGLWICTSGLSWCSHCTLRTTAIGHNGSDLLNIPFLLREREIQILWKIFQFFHMLWMKSSNWKKNIYSKFSNSKWNICVGGIWPERSQFITLLPEIMLN